ncbi:MAG: ATP synthase F1 subunit delta [Candidatus Kerfeldbacteria bacterium]|jgi:F-type H+-transporting ATPase subunit delta
MKNIPPKKYAISLYESIKNVDEHKLSDILKSFVGILIKNKDVNKVEKIIKAFRNYYNEQENNLEITVTTAEKIDQNILDMIKNKLSGSLNKEIEIKTGTDEKLIGGMVIKYNDTIIDGSVQRRIELLAETLK